MRNDFGFWILDFGFGGVGEWGYNGPREMMYLQGVFFVTLPHKLNSLRAKGPDIFLRYLRRAKKASWGTSFRDVGKSIGPFVFGKEAG